MKKGLISIVLPLWLIFFLSGCFVAENTFTGLAPGYWRATLRLEATPSGEILAESKQPALQAIITGELPFNFEVKYEGKDKFYLEIINGEERIRVDEIVMRRDPRTAKDSVYIDFPVFDSYIRGIFQENVIQGEWIVRNRADYSIPFVARHGQNHRFTTLKKAPAMNLSGKWEATFEIDTPDEYKAIGDFKQDGNYITGTFATETGDYRFLEGTVQGDKLHLSCFDGAHAFLFEAKIQADSTLIGSFYSGNHYKTTWEARKNDGFKLVAPEKLTFLKEGYDRFEFSFENPEGKMISINDPAYQGKVKIVQIMGSWCPNCRDETEFLLDYLKKNPNENLAVIALAFERHKEKSKAMEAISRYKNYFSIPYEMLLAGSSNKDEASKALPMLNQVLSFPTMIFIDRENKVQKIHTGFYGPATAEFKDFKAEFETFMKELLDKPL